MPEEIFVGGSKRWYADARLIILAIFFAGLCLRLNQLGSVPFSSEEAQNACSAFSVAKGVPVGTAASPAYEGLTSLTFFLLRASPFFARLWPALAGSSLALAPLFFRRRVGSLQAVLLAAAFAFDPVLFTLSRLAGGAIFLIVGLIWALIFFVARKPVGLGIALALAWLSGPWLWIILLVSGVGFGLFLLAGKQADLSGLTNACPFRTKAFRETAAVSFAVSLFLLASAFLLNPAGLSGIAGGLARLWPSSHEMTKTALTLPIYRLIAYSLPVLILAFLASLSAWREKERWGQLVSLLAGITLLAILLFRNQGTAGYALLQFLLWLQAVRTLEKQVQLEAGRRDIALGAFLLGIALCGYLALSAKNLVNPTQAGLTFGPGAIAFVLGLLLLVFVFFLVMMGWSLQTARKGILSAVVLSLLAFSLSLTFLALKPSDPYSALVWSESNVWVNADAQSLLLREIEKSGKLEAQVSRVVITDPQLADLRWDFRDYGRVEVLSVLPENYPPEILITAAPDQQKAADSYRGIQMFSPGRVPWEKFTPVEILRAAVSKSLPAESFSYYLWIRQDLMTGALP
ncbi:MAG TPA: hypothetical protein PKL60_07170 [Anaerolineaceae bacterium]|nr:hypothetical protein [Anaerolineaceae bacterium]